MRVLMYSQMGKGKAGGETVFRNVSDGLEKKGHEVIRLYCDYDLPTGQYRSVDGDWHISLSVPPTWKSCFRPTYLVRFAKSVIGLSRFLRRTEPDIVNVHFLTAVALNFALLKRVFGYSLALSCHGGGDVDHMRGMQRRSAPFVLSEADTVICVSEALAETVKAQVSADASYQVVHNGIDTEFWSCSSSSSGSDEKHVVTVGTLKDAKAHDVLIRAFRCVVDKWPDAVLTIVGDGPRRAECEGLIEKSGLSQNVRITGWQTPAEVRDILCNASLFAFPSRNEGFGIALAEAMAAGLPVVASTAGGIPEVVGDAESKLVAPDSVNQLTTALQDALEDEEWRARAGKASEQRAAMLSWQKVVSEYERVLSS